MPMSFHLYVPAEYTFKNYFIPKTKNQEMDWFEVDRHRYGVQKKGNNHLVVFLDFRLKQASPKFLDGKGDGAFHLKGTSAIKLFNKILGGQKEVAVYSLDYHTRMSVLAWKLLMDIADDDKVLITDDKGKHLKGPQFVRELKALMEMA